MSLADKPTEDLLDYSLEDQFRSLGKQWTELWGYWQIQVKFSQSDELSLFQKAGLKKQLWAIKHLEQNIEILKQIMESGDSPRNSKRYIWRIVSYLKLTPPSDFMNFIEDDDVVEIYCLTDEVQVFRNYRFMEMTSFTFEQLLFLPWYKLSKRSWKIMLKIVRVLFKFKLGFIKSVVPWNIPHHQFEEVGTTENNKFNIQLKYLIPLTGNGRVTSAISTNSSTATHL